MNHRLFALLSLCVGWLGVWSQPTPVDSLQQVCADETRPFADRSAAFWALASHYLNRRPDSARWVSQQYYELAQQVGDTVAMGQALTGLGLSSQIMGDQAQALAYTQQGMALAEATRDTVGIARAAVNLGLIYVGLGEYEAAIPSYLQGLKLHEVLGDQIGMARAAINLGIIYQDQGKFAEALAVFRQGLELVEALGNVRGQAIAAINIGIIYQQQEDFDLAERYLTRSLALAEEVQDPYVMIRALLNLGQIYAERGDSSQAVSTLIRSLEMSEASGDQGAAALSLVNLGTFYDSWGDKRQALTYAEQSLRIYEQIEDKAGLVQALVCIGEIHQSQGNYPRVVAAGERALPLAREVGELTVVARLAKVLYQSYKALGRPAEALSMLEWQIEARDSLNNETNQRATLRYEYQQQALQDSLVFVEQQAQTELVYQRRLGQRNLLLIGGLGLGAVGFLLVYFRLQRRSRERELARLQQVDKLKDQFLANTSHELRTPLNGIIGLAEALYERETEPEDQQNLGMIVAAGKRLNALVNDLLDFSRLRNADLVLRFKPVDLRTLVQLVFRVSGPLTQGKDLVLSNEVPRDLPAAWADEDRVVQILHNLIGNAIKFTERGSVKAGAALQGEYLRVWVQDTGIGIAPEKHEAIFAAFEQADGSISRQYSGTGLGLSITKQLVERQGGQIGLESALGQGARFWFTLPRSTEPAAAETTVETLTPLQPLGSERLPVAPIVAGTGPRARLLLVDDEPINHQVLHSHLRRDRFELVSAMNGPEALAQLAQAEKPFDLILLDIMMPRMSGYEVAQQVRERYLPSELPIIMLTAKNQVADLVQGLNTGANDYLVKPFSKDEFLARLNTHLNLGQINRATGRFVPNAFLHSLGKNSITEVALGDHIMQEVTVFFSDIRSYTSLAEKMSPAETFGFVNAYAGRMGPIIQRHQGFINQYLGDGIMAIFQRSPDDARQAAIEMQAAIGTYNQQRTAKGWQALKVGMGFHTGPLVMGIIGDALRTDPAVISDTVNTAARLEGLTKYYGANILLSETSYASFDAGARAQCRYIGLVQVKGREQPLGIYESFAGDEASLQAQKQGTLPQFEAGVHHFLTGEMALAREAFGPLAQAGDPVAQRLATQAQHYLDTGLPADWAGVEVMQGK